MIPRYETSSKIYMYTCLLKLSFTTVRYSGIPIYHRGIQGILPTDGVPTGLPKCGGVKISSGTYGNITMATG